MLLSAMPRHACTWGPSVFTRTRPNETKWLSAASAQKIPTENKQIDVEAERKEAEEEQEEENIFYKHVCIKMKKKRAA